MKQTNLARYYFHQGTNYTSYSYLGCNREFKDGKYHYAFRTWAPSADRVELLSDFYGWDNPVKLERISEQGLWEHILICESPIEKSAYKFRITKDGVSHNKGDPYARFSRGLDDGASLIFTESSFRFTDGAWMKRRMSRMTKNNGAYLSLPINIYEAHLGSFMTKEDGSPLSYREFADVITPYLKSMGYTHLELLPIMEHPYGGSWGYQVGAFYAPTSRYGDPDDFRYLVNKLHTSGLGIILDWVPAHFPKDEWGLYEFDGTRLYEYQGKDRMESRSWGTRFFDLGREEVQSFLISNALYYFREFHIDGLRVDAVASMLYLDYDRDAGEWIPNCEGTNTNLEAVAFFKKLNTAIFGEFPDVLMIAEESGSYGRLTHPVYNGGLGFNMKWNMGFANDLYDYLSLDPAYRQGFHKALTFPLMYAFKENYCLPISHDEVVHGKRSFIDKMYGEYEDKFQQMRASLLLIMTYPGKKLMFMGTEFAQFREWDYESSLEWFMSEYPNHKYMREYVRALNSFYLSSSELWEIDFAEGGFRWIYPDLNDKNTVVYRRYNTKGDSFIVAINFSGAGQDLRIPLNKCKYLDCIFASSDNICFDGITVHKEGEEHAAYITLPRFSGAVFKEKLSKRHIKIVKEND